MGSDEQIIWADWRSPGLEVRSNLGIFFRSLMRISQDLEHP